uniref:Uncharacterized protein n=1 Tax=Panagrolaimus sp. ES5 TaxID=591445 RepID=A0AC34F6L3_9BILA
MLRLYRYFFIRSRSLTPLKQHVVERNSVNVQSFRLASSNIHESRKHGPRTKQTYQSKDTQRKSRPSTAVAEAEDENEKFINSLTNRGDFYGVRATRSASEPVSVETAVSKLQRWFSSNQRITARSFVKAILIPLQQKDPAILRLINLDPSSHIPFFIRCCGLIISDVSEDQKLLILEHLLQAFKDNDIKLDIHAYNAILKVWLENSCEFDVNKILEKVEIDLKLEPNVDFYNSLLWRLAELKDVKGMEKMLLKMTSRGIVPNLDTELVQIFAASATGSDKNAEMLVEKVLQKYGNDSLPECLSARIRGTLLHGNIDKFRKLLRSAVIATKSAGSDDPLEKEKYKKYILNISYDALFDIIWRLAKLSIDGDGQEFTALSQQILDSAYRATGFFKRLIRETERHIAHKYYYSAAALIGDTNKIKRILDVQQKDTFQKQLMPRLANHMIRNRASNEVIKDVANRLIVSFGPELRFFDELAFSILLFKGYDYDERFKMFSHFVDSFDPERSRPHIILPLLVRCPDLEQKQMLLYRIAEIGYTNIALISPFMIVRNIYRPMLDLYMEKDPRSSDIDKLSLMSQVLESFNCKPEDTWKSLFEYVKDVNDKKYGFYLPVDLINLKKWLSYEYEKMFQDKVAEAERKKAKFSYEVFKRLLKNQDVERIHSFLVQRDENEKEYLPKAESPLKSSQLITCLKRYFNETNNIQSVIEYVYELRRLFPDAVVTMETRNECSKAVEFLFGSILMSDNVTVESLQECVDLLTLLLKYDFVILTQSEIATVYIIEKINLRFGWDAAVDTWLKFQSNLHCTNGLFSLMKYAISLKDNTKIQYLLHRAKNFVSSSRVNSLLAGAYLYNGEYEKAKEIFEKEHENLLAHDCANVFQILNHLKKDGVLEFIELCLKHTNLRSDEKRKNFFIRGVVNKYQGPKNTNQLKFYFLLKKYGLYFDERQMKTLSEILQPSRNAFE